MEQSEKKSICLNMIVKNESHIIIETLKNLCSYIDFGYWVISDTGSTDNVGNVKASCERLMSRRERDFLFCCTAIASSPQDYSNLLRIVNFFKLQAKRLHYKNESV